jgi:hypothetical protein
MGQSILSLGVTPAHRALAPRIVELTAVNLLPQARLCLQFWRWNKSLPWTF